MTELQSSYRERLYISEKEIIDAKDRHESLFKDYLSYEMTDKDVIKFIGDNLLFSLFIINAQRTSNYLLISESYDYHIEDIRELLNDDNVIRQASPSEGGEIVRLTVRILELFYEHAGPDEFLEVFSHAAIDGANPLFYECEIEYLNGWEYEDQHRLSPHYKFFYRRMAELFLEHGISILSSALHGIFTGMYDMLSIFDNFFVDGLGIDETTKEHEYRKHPDIMKKLIMNYIKDGI